MSILHQYINKTTPFQGSEPFAFAGRTAVVVPFVHGSGFCICPRKNRPSVTIPRAW